MSSQCILILLTFSLSVPFICLQHIFIFSHVPLWLLLLPSSLLFLPSLWLLCPFKFTCVDLFRTIIFCHFSSSSDSCYFSHVCSPLSFHPMQCCSCLILVPLLSCQPSFPFFCLGGHFLFLTLMCVYMPSRYTVYIYIHGMYNIYIVTHNSLTFPPLSRVSTQQKVGSSTISHLPSFPLCPIDSSRWMV